MSAYDEGFRARLRGDAIEANPHSKPSKDWSRWAEGWMDQDQHLTDRDEALDSIGWFGARSR
jgi:hypothetical protein